MMKSSTTGIIDDIKSILRLPSLTRGIEDLRNLYVEITTKRLMQMQSAMSRESKQADKARTIKGQLMQKSLCLNLKKKLKD